MNTQIAVGLLTLILLLLGADALFNEWEGSIFLARKFAELTEWMAFWR